MNRLEKLHNDEYQDLKSRGFSGWGAESLEKRIEGFSRIIKLLEGTSEWIKPPARILDIGCGAGQLTLMLAERKYSMTGVDFSSTAIEMAEHNFKKHGYSGEFLCTEIQNIVELNLEPYDAVFDSNAFHCITDMSERRRAYSAIGQMLKPGGIFVLNHMIGEPREIGGERSYCAEKKMQIYKSVPYRYMPSLNELKEEISENGFVLLKGWENHFRWWDSVNYMLLKK